MSQFNTLTKFQALNGLPATFDEEKKRKHDLHRRLYRTVGWRELREVYWASQRNIWPEKTTILGISYDDSEPMAQMVEKQWFGDLDSRTRERKSLVGRHL